MDTSPVSAFASHSAAWLYWISDACRPFAITDGRARDCVAVWALPLLSYCSPFEQLFSCYGLNYGLTSFLLIKWIYQGRVHPTGSQSIESPLLTLAHPGSIE